MRGWLSRCRSDLSADPWEKGQRGSDESLRDDVVGDRAMDIGEAEVASGIAVGELLVIESHEVQDGRVKVVDVHAFVDGGEAEVVAGAVHATAFHAASGEPDGEAVIVVVASLGTFGGRGSAELAAPKDEGVIEEPAFLEIAKEHGDRLIGLLREGAMVGDVVVIVPGLSASGEHLDHADTAFNEAARGEAGLREGRFSVGLAHGFGFARKVENVLCLELHPEGHFEGMDTRLERVIVAMGIGVASIHGAEEIHEFALGTWA